MRFSPLFTHNSLYFSFIARNVVSYDTLVYCCITLNINMEIPIAIFVFLTYTNFLFNSFRLEMKFRTRKMYRIVIHVDKMRESRAFDVFVGTFLSTCAKNYFFRGRYINFYFMQSRCCNVVYGEGLLLWFDCFLSISICIIIRVLVRLFFSDVMVWLISATKNITCDENINKLKQLDVRTNRNEME